jgi:hypothetical protein
VTTDVQHLVDERVILVTHVGHVGQAEMQAAGEKGFAMARETGIWSFLSDCSQMQQGPRIFDQLGLAQMLQAMGVLDRYRQALVRPTSLEAAETVLEWETVSANRGIRVRVVPDRETGLRWLQES